jgi:antitoxin StbD
LILNQIPGHGAGTHPTDNFFANVTVSVTELKRHNDDILKKADDGPVAVLNHNRPEAYLVPAAHYERLLNYLADLEDALIVKERAEGPFIDVTLAEL